jgi:hypothetical protein
MKREIGESVLFGLKLVKRKMGPSGAVSSEANFKQTPGAWSTSAGYEQGFVNAYK